MAWISVLDAGQALQCSERTLRRKIKAGHIESRTIGGRLELNIDTDKVLSSVSGQARHLVDVSTAHAIQAKADSDNMTGTLSALNRAIEGAHKAASQAREAEERAEARAVRAVSWAAVLTATITLGAGALLAAGAYRYNAESVRHATQVATFRTTNTQLKSENRRLGDANQQGVATVQSLRQDATEALKTLTAATQRGDSLASDLEAARRALVDVSWAFSSQADPELMGPPAPTEQYAGAGQ